MSKVIHNLDPVPTSEERHLLITAEKDTNAMQISGGPSVCRDGFSNHVSSPVLVILFVLSRSHQEASETFSLRAKHDDCAFA